MGSLRCNKCMKLLNDDNFYTYKNVQKVEICKKCLTLHIDNFDPSTFLWLLEKMDVPYIEEEWNILRDRAFNKDPKKMNGMSVFGKYLSKMKLKQWKEYSWADTERLKAEKQAAADYDAATAESIKAREQELKEQLDNGEIPEAEYKTLVSTATLAEEYAEKAQEEHDQYILGDANFYNENEFISEDELIDLAAELTQEDKVYLAMKWGRFYRPNEWVEMERKYNEMMESFDIQDSDTTGTLILICKTYLKMNQAIDQGDMEGFQKLSRVYDSLRKSAKFTAAQNKEQKNDFIDSIGELVAYCEKEGGAIPRYDLSYDQDIIDKVIRDFKHYNQSLIKEDISLSHEIEDYLKRREIAEQQHRDKMLAREQGKDYIETTDEDMQEHLENLAQQQEETQKIMKGLEESEEE